MKQFKDPIYGYINIPKEIVRCIIDTPTFQRLRYIQQTSYLPVYSAALHNRFIHSLGVYFLGEKACNAIMTNSSDVVKAYDTNKVGIDIQQIFKLACLLHDVGHAPFSHSGEDFFIDDKKTIYENLKSAVGDEKFSEDVEYYHKNAKPAAPHEIMSVVVALKQFPQLFPNIASRDFFARCITGYKYKDFESNPIEAFLNAFISLLNSSTIDVDRLDYLIRDAFVMGYNSISIDYNRLLESLILIKTEDSVNHTPIQLAYTKSALSVIENVIYAHDSERKWVQNHPIILYEVFLIQQIIHLVKSKYKELTNKDLFSLDSLLPNENEKINEYYEDSINRLNDLISSKPNSKENEAELSTLSMILDNLTHLKFPHEISSLCDDDIVHIAKKIHHPLCLELFNRAQRRHPVWKSESEYGIYVDGFIGDGSNEKLHQCIKLLNSFIRTEVPSHCIGDEALTICRNKIDEIEKLPFSDKDKDDMYERYKLILKWIEALQQICETSKLKNFELVIVPAVKFESGFKKKDLAEIPIYFPNVNKHYLLKDLINLLSFNESKRKKYFYVYYKREKDEKIDPILLGKTIGKLVLE